MELLLKNVKNNAEGRSLLNHRDSKAMTPLHWAARGGHIACVELLVAKGADVNAHDENGRSARMMAAQGGSLSCLKFLTEHHASEADGQAALMKAAMRGNLQCMQYLVERGAGVNDRNHWGETPLITAAEWGRVSCVQFLISKGADVHEANNDGHTPLSCAARRGHITCLKILLEHGALSSGGMLALLLAAEWGQRACVEYLIVKGVNVNGQDSDGNTPLIKAAEGGNLACIEVLVENGAAVINMQNDHGEDALIMAAKGGHLSCIQYLIDSGADVNAKRSNWYLSLQKAAETGGRESFVNRIAEALASERAVEEQILQASHITSAGLRFKRTSQLLSPTAGILREANNIVGRKKLDSQPLPPIRPQTAKEGERLKGGKPLRDSISKRSFPNSLFSGIPKLSSHSEIENSNVDLDESVLLSEVCCLHANSNYFQILPCCSYRRRIAVSWTACRR